LPGDHFRSISPLAGRFEGAASAIAWKQMAGAGNVYRHDYEDVAAQFVWDTVQRALPSLREVVEVEITRQA
jgi:uncharacterized protein with HEPN domain